MLRRAMMAAGGGGSVLLGKIDAYWEGEDTLASSKGSYTLSASGTLTYDDPAVVGKGFRATGLISGPAPFARLATDSFCMGGWVRLAANATQVFMSAVSAGSGFEAPYLLYLSGQVYAGFRRVNSEAGDQVNVIYSPPGGYSYLSSDYVFYVMRLAGGVLSLFLDGEEVVSVTTSFQPFLANDLRLGYAYTSQYNQRFDQLFVSQALSDAEISYLYNSGAGRSFAEL